MNHYYLDKGEYHSFSQKTFISIKREINQSIDLTEIPEYTFEEHSTLRKDILYFNEQTQLAMIRTKRKREDGKNTKNEISSSIEFKQNEINYPKKRKINQLSFTLENASQLKEDHILNNLSQIKKKLNEPMRIKSIEKDTYQNGVNQREVEEYYIKSVTDFDLLEEFRRQDHTIDDSNTSIQYYGEKDFQEKINWKNNQNGYKSDAITEDCSIPNKLDEAVCYDCFEDIPDNGK